MSFPTSSSFGYVPNMTASHKHSGMVAPPSVESMFERIMDTVQKSVSRLSSVSAFSVGWAVGCWEYTVRLSVLTDGRHECDSRFWSPKRLFLAGGFFEGSNSSGEWEYDDANFSSGSGSNKLVSTEAAPSASDEVLHSEIAELRQQCAELRISNANLERLVKDGQISGHHANGHSHHHGENGRYSPQSSPKPRNNKSPFLTTHPLPYQHRIPSPPLLCVPSPTSERPPTTQYHSTEREIPGFYVVIPAGGAGTRLWPLSRENHPKFLLDVNLCGRSLIQTTWDRLVSLSSPARTTVVAGPSHAQAILDQLPELNTHNLFIEPGPKDSMAAIGLAAAILSRRDPDAIIGSFAADHMVSGTDAFLSAVAEAVEVARSNSPGYLVTIGIAPSNPATGFGYVRLGESLNLANAPNARLVGSFKEKPDARTAASYLATGNYRWNAGMFVTRAAFLMQLLQEYKPELYDGLMKIAELWDAPSSSSSASSSSLSLDGSQTGESQDRGSEKSRKIEEIWSELEKIAIDNAVAEPAAAEGRVAVIPATFGWDDVGDFSSLSEMLPAELNHPKILGDHSLVLTEQAAGGIVIPGSGRLIACLGVDDLVIVDMPDALMVTTRARSQEVKRLVKRAKECGWKVVL